MKPYIIPNDDRDYTDTIKFQNRKTNKSLS